ncbi:hypothetical protein [Streptomyces sp. bgisy060]|uniref:hypothetical protein n=1 Tax=Streptomyces sp. bgisy060 TaxID=3413775 RepID=UPI003EBE356E
MTSGPPIKIHVIKPDDPDADGVDLTDVGVVTIDGERHLFLKPQSFTSAVRQIRKAMPDLPVEHVERLVRDHASDFRDFDELLAQPVERRVPPVDLPALPTVPTVLPQRTSPRRWLLAAALVPAFVGTWALGHATAQQEGVATAASEADRPSISKMDKEYEEPAPFEAGAFRAFSKAGKIACRPIGNLEAECTDSDGMVMATTAATGPDSTIFTFSYGAERLGLRIFEDIDYAETWSQQDGSQAMYPNMQRWGRFVLWGTDDERLADYLAELRSAAKQPPVAFGLMEEGEKSLPPRLAALALGTLGLEEGDVEDIVLRPERAGVPLPALHAARVVLGIDDGDRPRIKPGVDDIVALAAGIETEGTGDVETTAWGAGEDLPSGEGSGRDSKESAAPQPTPTPEMTVTSDPTPTPTRTAEATPTPTPMHTAEQVPTPTPSESEVPAPALTKDMVSAVERRPEPGQPRGLGRAEPEWFARPWSAARPV